MATKVNSIEHLRQMLADGGTHDFFIQLNFGLRSSKDLSSDGEKFWVLNLIDGTEQVLTEEELFDEDVTNIGKAIKLGAFFKY